VAQIVFKNMSGVHRRSQGGAYGAMAPHKFFKYLVILCFERRYSKQNAVASLK